MLERPAIMALDPGELSGVAFHDHESGALWFRELPFLEACEVLHAYAIAYASRIAMQSESYTITMQTVKMSSAPWSLELIGVARHASQKYTARDLSLISPADAKKLATNERLRDFGYWTPGLKGHANDAARVLMHYEATHRGYMTEEQLRKLE